MADRFTELFEHPDRTYTPVPFWFLNGVMDRERIRAQLEDFRAHGVYGVVMHPRMGFDPSVPYLSPAFMDWMAYIVETAGALDMFVFLYDEGMYPSGSACGQVVRENPEFAARGLMLLRDQEPAHGRLIARIAARLNGGLYDPKQARLLADAEAPAPDETLLCLVEDFSHGTIRGLLPTQDDGLPDAPPAADLLNPEAVQCFIRLTHERYYARMPQAFGTTIRAMFTDEPNPLGRNAPASMLAWSTGTAAQWLAEGYALEDLPALFMDAVPDAAHVSADYERFLQACMLRSYYEPLRAWCESHAIALTGHPAHADSIGLERAFTIPGQDLVWRWVAPGETATQGVESTQAHCAADSMINTGKRRCLDECFGCCGPDGSQWGMTVADMRWMMDYLMVRGVNLLAPHAFFYHMDPVISAQDRPPDVGPSNYWWKHYSLIADYIARVCGISAEGSDAADIALLACGEHLPWQLAEPLMQHQLPFHYLEVCDLTDAPVGDGALMVAGHAYRAVIVPAGQDEGITRRLDSLSGQGVLILYANGHSMQPVVDRLLANGFAPVSLQPRCDAMRVSCRMLDGVQSLMLFNEGEAPWEGTVQLRAAGYLAACDAWTGKARPLTSPADRCHLRIEAKQSLLLTIRSHGTPYREPEPEPISRAISLHDVTLTCPDGVVLPLEALRSWQELPGLEAYNGTLTYTAAFSLPVLPRRAMLSLGEVHELAEVSVNGYEEQALLLPPFALDVTAWLRKGDNTVSIRVTSSRVTDYEQKPWPCGLTGEVILYISE